MRRKEGDANDTGLQCYEAKLQCVNQKEVSPLGTLYKQGTYSLRVISGKAGE